MTSKSFSKDSFNSVIESVKPQGEHFVAQVTAAWMQGRASFGGLVAAMGVEAMQQALINNGHQQHPLRGLQVLFVGPVGVDPVRIETQLLRKGKNVTSMRADLIQAGQVCCSVMACFGASRQSMLNVGVIDRPDVPAPETLEPFHYVEGVTPKFTQQFDMRWAEGDRPFTNCQSRTHGIWTRFFEEGEASIAHVIAIADIPPPVGLSMLTEPANGSSLTWSLEFLGDEWQANMHDWWYVRTELAQCSQGYAQQKYIIWAPSGQPIAIASQVMTVFA